MGVTLHPTAEPKPQSRPDQPGGGGFGAMPPPTRGWGGGDSGGDEYHSEQRYTLAVWVGIAGIVMFFAAISSAMIVRRSAEDWLSLEPPAILWASTAALALSSATFELAKRAVRHGGVKDLRRWITATALLGVGFIAAQLAGWSDLLSQGIGLSGHPSAMFFYLFTAAHGAHVLGGICALGYVTARASLRRTWPRPKAVVEAAALYWHFMGVLWLYILALLSYLG